MNFTSLTEERYCLVERFSSESAVWRVPTEAKASVFRNAALCFVEQRRTSHRSG
ncbi:MAG: hypothetical protein GDA56_16230 [Hormoscilla sp. GM7CHS1pb]|nr:hypothetical protein [Hormoscilla sp. GM7CHS1pb]